MNDNELKAVIEVAQMIAIVVTSVLAYLTRRDVRQVVTHTNSMKDELVAAVKLAATETGKDIGRKEMKEEQALGNEKTKPFDKPD